MRLLAIHKSKLLVVFALVCALASTGFAHRFVSQPVDPALAGYVSAGGSLADICGETEGSSHQNVQTCEACRLVTAVVLPDHGPARSVPFGKLSTVQVPVADLDMQSAPLDLSRAARGPPTV